jgi:predicted neutral ceramidase superfamily lipid hydrolase
MNYMENIFAVNIRYKHLYYLTIFAMVATSLIGMIVSDSIFTTNFNVMLYIRVNTIILCAIGLTVHNNLTKRILLNLVGWFMLIVLICFWLHVLPKDFMTLTYGDSMCIMNLSIICFFGSSYLDH